MVAIFSATSTWLAKEFVVKIPTNVLSLAIDNLNSISGVNCKRIKGDVKVSGKWQDLVTAHALLEQCLDVNSIDIEDEKKCDVLYEPPKESAKNNVNKQSSDSKVVVVKTEEDPEWVESKDFDDAENEFDDAEDEESDSGGTKKARGRAPPVDYADDEDTQDLDLTTEHKNIKQKKGAQKKSSLKKGRFNCTKCSYSGKLEKQLVNHMNRKHLRKYKCGECGKKYGYKADLARHKSEVHADRDKYFCKICNKYLKTKAYIEDHMQLHNDNYVYHCKLCDKSFSTKLIFAKHVKIKHPKSKSVIEEIEGLVPTSTDTSTAATKDENTVHDSGNDSCNSDREDKKLETKVENMDSSELMMNIMSADDDDKVLHETDLFKVSLKRGRNRGRPRIKSYYDGRTEFPCHLCEYVGKKECHLEYHIKRNHSQKLICDICNKQFGYNWDLKRHREQVHAEASYFCHICSKAYKVKKSFDEHLKSHEDGYVKSRYPCTECDKTFSAKQVLDNHIKFKHLGAKPKEKQRYLCQTCGQEFYHKYSYHSHMNKHQGLMPYNCSICGKKFASEHSVREHQIVHKDTRNHCCKFCSKTFKTSSALKAHEAIHVNAKDYKCSVCNKGFVQKQSLLRHERIHSGYKPYKCLLCDRPFTDSATVRKHMILVHKKDPHNWQSGVMSDLKRPRELWSDDWEEKKVKGANLNDGAVQQEETMVMDMYNNTVPVLQQPDIASVPVPPHSVPVPPHSVHSVPQQLPDHQSHIISTDHDPNMMGHMPDTQNTAGALTMIRSPPITMQDTPLMMSSVPHTAGSVHQQHMDAERQASNSIVEMAAASILNLSAHLPPLPNPMHHMSAVQHIDGQMPSILNLSTMHNLNYNHQGSG